MQNITSPGKAPHVVQKKRRRKTWRRLHGSPFEKRSYPGSFPRAEERIAIVRALAMNPESCCSTTDIALELEMVAECSG